MTEYIPLSELPIGTVCKVVSVDVDNRELRRFSDLGIVEGTMMKSLMVSPLGDPVAYLIRGAVFAIRREDSSRITVERY
ncbi:MAG: ferrous iron transport protein A [Ruminococcaceae bacterium]|nr:ferrous iron transport protein A [Oscillospiraceae bacterium]